MWQKPAGSTCSKRSQRRCGRDPAPSGSEQESAHGAPGLGLCSRANVGLPKAFGKGRFVSIIGRSLWRQCAEQIGGRGFESGRGEATGRGCRVVAVVQRVRGPRGHLGGKPEHLRIGGHLSMLVLPPFPQDNICKQMKSGDVA